MNTATDRPMAEEEPPHSEVTVRWEGVTEPAWSDALERYLTAALRVCAAPIPWEVALVCTDDTTVRALNYEYRGIDAPTDILSFLHTEGNPIPGLPGQGLPEGTVGDLVLSPAAVKRNAEEFGVPFEEEMRRVVLHGVLHLCGHDHSTNDFTTEPMLRLQEELLKLRLRESLF